MSPVARAGTPSPEPDACPRCGGPQQRWKATSRQPYVYSPEGIRAVHLRGITILRCPTCMVDSPRILRRRQLHNLIAGGLLRRDGRLAGEEIRFLRTHARIPSGRFATLLGIDPSHLSRVENGKAPYLGVPADRLARLVAAGALQESGAGSTADRGRLRKIHPELIEIFGGEGRSASVPAVPATFKLARGGGWKGEG